MLPTMLPPFQQLGGAALGTSTATPPAALQSTSVQLPLWATDIPDAWAMQVLL
jgi:hypothetical protein